MNSTPVSIVHGHTLNELSDLIGEVCPDVEGLWFSGILAGGWSNINLLGETEIGKYIIKVPPLIDPYENNPYRYRFRISKSLFKHQICPEPIAIGHLNDIAETPFMVSEFVSGASPSNAGTMNETEIKSILIALNKLAEIKPSGIKRFATASEYVHHLSSPISIDYEPSEFVRDIAKEFLTINERLLEHADSLEWAQKTMHGDLHEPNIIFQTDNVILLDFEACCLGTPSFDIAYLFTQSQISESPEYPECIVADYVNKTKLAEMEPLALFSAIAWTLERFINLEKKMVEPNLSGIELKQAHAVYLQTKIPLLKKMLE